MVRLNQKESAWENSVTIGYDDSGRMIRKWVYARTIAEMEQKIAEE